MNSAYQSTEGEITSVEFQSVEADFVAAYQLHGAPTRRIWLVLSISAVVFVSAVLAYRLDTERILFVIACLIGGLLGGLATRYIYYPWQARRAFAQYPLARLTSKLTLRPEGIAVESPRGVSALQWADFIRWRANSKILLLYTSPHIFLFLPTRLTELGFPIDRLKDGLSRGLGPPVR